MSCLAATLAWEFLPSGALCAPADGPAKNRTSRIIGAAIPLIARKNGKKIEGVKCVSKIFSGARIFEPQGLKPNVTYCRSGQVACSNDQPAPEGRPRLAQGEAQRNPGKS